MWVSLYVLAINFLVYESLAAPQYIEHVQVERDLNDTYDGYRCGKRVLRREYLEEETRHAASTFGLYTLVPEFDFDSQTYAGRLNFGTRTTNPIMWQLLQDENAPVQTIVEYFVILDVMNGGGLRIAGVLRRRNGNDLKCIREKDLSEVSAGHEFATGYRCPYDIYTFDIIEKVIGSSLEEQEAGIKLHYVDTHQFLDSVNGKPLLFDDSEKLISRRITPTGKLHNMAGGAIITDQKFHFVGMVFKKKGVHVRCKLTVSDRLQLKFIGPALIQKPESVSLESVDVFQCGFRMFSSEEILKIAGDALEAFKKRSTTEIYHPAIHDSSDINQRLYRWPIQRIVFQKIYDIPITVPNKRFFALIDDFSDVYNVVEMIEPHKYIGCQRGLAEKNVYDESLRIQLPHSIGQTSGKRKFPYH